MKGSLHFAIIVCLSFLLCGCPYSSPYGIDAVATQNIDEGLLGNWACLVNKPAPETQTKMDSVKICFSKYTDQEYAIVITGGIKEFRPFHCMEKDTIKATGYLSTIGQHQFLNAFVKGRIYIAEVKKVPGGISILCLAERFTARFIKNSDQLRGSLAFHYKVAITPAYDDFFVLRNLQKQY